MHRRENLSGKPVMPTQHAKMMCGDIYATVRGGQATTQASSAIRKASYLVNRQDWRETPVTRRAFRGEPMEQWDRLLVGADTGAKKSQVEVVCDRSLAGVHSLTKAHGVAPVSNSVHSQLQSRSDGR